jgi:hypothetical protein
MIPIAALHESQRWGNRAAPKNLSAIHKPRAALLLLMLGAGTTVTPFHHQPEAAAWTILLDWTFRSRRRGRVRHCQRCLRFACYLHFPNGLACIIHNADARVSLVAVALHSCTACGRDAISARQPANAIEAKCQSVHHSAVCQSERSPALSAPVRMLRRKQH